MTIYVRPHGTHIKDFPWIKQLFDITVSQAVDFLSVSPYVLRIRNSWDVLLPKEGFVLAKVFGENAFFVAKHEEKYYLYMAEANRALDKFTPTIRRGRQRE